MQKVLRGQILDFVTYEERRAELRTAAMAEKAVRRVHVGQNLTFLFENTTTVRYQILEMVRAERMVRESDIAHEIETYNELLGGPGSWAARSWWRSPRRRSATCCSGSGVRCRRICTRAWPTAEKFGRSWTSGRRTRSGSPACSI